MSEKPFRKVITQDEISQLKKHPDNIIQKEIKCVQFEYEDSIVIIFKSAHKDIFIVLEQEPYDTEPVSDTMSNGQISDMYGEEVTKLVEALP